MLHWNYAFAQATEGRSESKSIDDDFRTFRIDQNEPVGVGPSTSRALTLQGPVIDFDQSAEHLTKFGKIAKFFSSDENPCCKHTKEC